MEDDTQEIIKNPEQKQKKTWKNTISKGEVCRILKEQMPVEQAAKLAGITTNYAYKIKPIKENATLHNLAVKNVKRLASGKKYGDIEELKCSTVLAANTVILDRTEPKINRIEQDTRSSHVEITADVSEWANNVLKSIGCEVSPDALPYEEVSTPDAPHIINDKGGEDATK